MLRKVVTSQAVKQFVARTQNCSRIGLGLHGHIYTPARHLSSNDDLKKTLNDINNKYNANTNTTTDSVQDESAGANQENSSTDPSQTAEPTTSNAASSSRGIMDIFRSSYNIVLEKTKVISDQTKLAWGEITGEGRETVLTKSVEQASTFRPAQKTKDLDEEGNEIEREEEPTGPNSIVLVKDAQSYWGQMKDRVQASPLIKEILKGTRNAGKVISNTDIGKGAENVARSVQDKIHDAREFWETSQNPIVYTLSGLWDNVSGETEEGMATKAIMGYDPNFVKEVWSEEVRTKLAPKILKAHLMGDTAALKPWLGEAVYSKLAADIRARKHDGIVFDHNILEIDETQLIMKLVESNSSPIIVVVYMVQQINCIRNRKGEIIEGSETDIRAKFYSMAFQQSYNEDTKVTQWKIVDYEFAGDQPYL